MSSLITLKTIIVYSFPCHKNLLLLTYHSGGAGYVLSKNAFEKIGSKLKKDFSYCPNTGVEDLDVGNCLKLLNILPQNSIDEFGRER